MEFPMLFSPIRINGLEIRNRFVIPPMATNLGHADGTVSDALVAYWAARARGGWGLMIVEFCAVDPLGRGLPAELGVWDDRFIPGLRRLTDVAHGHGVPIALQIHHAGRQTISAFTGAQPVAPSPIPCPLMKEQPRELAADEIWALVEQFGDAAVRAREAGFDAVEVHGAHGYLIAQFLSAYSNSRTDAFGGSLDNRLRFAVEILRNVKRKAGADYPVLFRFSGDEYVEGGRTVEESKLVARAAQEAGADVVDVSAGVYESLMTYLIPPVTVPEGFNLPAAAAIKQSVSVPVIAVGRITDPALAEHALATGMADLIAWGRQSLADPEVPNKVAAGRQHEIILCDACQKGCTNRVLAAQTVECVNNPATGHELEVRAGPLAALAARG